MREFEAFTADLYRLADWLAEPGSSYAYTVTARSAGGDSPASEAAGIDFPDPPPETRNVSAAVRTPEAAHESVQVTLTWSAAPEPQAQACEDSYPVTQYRISRSAAHSLSDMPSLVEMYRSGMLNLDDLVVRHYSLDQINEAYGDMDKGEVGRGAIVFD